MLIVSVREKQDVRFIGTEMEKKAIFYWSEFFFLPIVEFQLCLLDQHMFLLVMAKDWCISHRLLGYKQDMIPMDLTCMVQKQT